MEQIGVQELRQNASQYLSRVASRQESIEITDRGRPIARLVPITNDDWANMIAAGEIVQADPDIDVRDVKPLAADVNASEILRELREHER
jgi:prevent-host-death family protein